MTSNVPPPEVIKAIESGSTRVLGKAEIYESDGETLWKPNGQPQPSSLLIEGSVTVDYARKERRIFELKLSTNKGQVQIGANGGLWYNHIIKLYRGVRYQKENETPRIVIIEADSEIAAYQRRQMFSNIGFSDVSVKLNASSFTDVADYDIIVSATAHEVPAKSDILRTAYSAGKSVISMGLQNDPSTVPLIIDGVFTTAQAYIAAPVPYDTPLAGGWSAGDAGVHPGYRPTEARATATVVAIRGAGHTFPMAIIEESANGGRWFHYQLPTVGTEAQILIRKAVLWLRKYQSHVDWYTPLGEFVIDKLSESHFPDRINVSGRDLTKKCMTSKLEKSMSFSAGTAVEQLVVALAANAGITKIAMPGTGVKLTSSVELERGTERWSVMQQVANSAGYEIFFDRNGYLTMREYRDPTLSPIYATFKTGPDGNISTSDKTINDDRLYNHIVITGENEAQDGAAVTLPYFGEAKNEDPSSPTAIEYIGDRAYFFTSTFFTSDEQCQALAESWLKIHSLETFELNWTSFAYPWMEVGEVVEVLEPKRLETDPVRYLLDTLSIPIGPGAMSATGKRVTYVGLTASGEPEILSPELLDQLQEDEG